MVVNGQATASKTAHAPCLLDKWTYRHTLKTYSIIVVWFLLGNSTGVWNLYADVSEHTVCSIFIGRWVWSIIHTSYLPAYEDGPECSETSVYKVQTPENYPEESIQLQNKAKVWNQEYNIILTAFPLRNLLHEHASVLRSFIFPSFSKSLRTQVQCHK